MVGKIAVPLIILPLLTFACGGGDEPPAASRGASAGLATPTVTPAPVDGPRASVEPSSGPPGTEVTVQGSGWRPGAVIDVIGSLDPGTTAEPYGSVLTDEQGSFSVSFRLEGTPDGRELDTGRYNLIARSQGEQVEVPFLVETRRPVTGGGPSG